MSTVTERLTQLKERVEQAKTKLAQAEGRATELKRQMKEQFGVDTVEGARKLADKKEAEALKIERALEKELERLEEQAAAMGGK